jgi:hypothetical protein
LVPLPSSVGGRSASNESGDGRVLDQALKQLVALDFRIETDAFLPNQQSNGLKSTWTVHQARSPGELGTNSLENLASSAYVKNLDGRYALESCNKRTIQAVRTMN